jgi:predicted methyltransferase
MLWAAASGMLAFSTLALALPWGPDPALKAAVASPARSAADVARDPVRHPVEELTYFGLKKNQTVVELWPGGGYWTAILGPYLARSWRPRWATGISTSRRPVRPTWW